MRVERTKKNNKSEKKTTIVVGKESLVFCEEKCSVLISAQAE